MNLPGWNRPDECPPVGWSRGGRLRFVAATVAATTPVWPVIQDGRVGREEMLTIGDVAVLVPVVLVFPVVWALLGRSRRAGWAVGALLIVCVGTWAMGTVTATGFATPPTVDDGLRAYLVVAGVGVTAAVLAEGLTVREWRSRTAVGVWLCGWAVAAAVPNVGDPGIPPGGEVFPLPSNLIVAGDEVLPCDRSAMTRSCMHTIRITAADGSQGEDLVRAVARHLEDATGQRFRWYPFSQTPDVRCRPSGRFLDPYELCVGISLDASGAAEVRLNYSNPHNPIF